MKTFAAVLALALLMASPALAFETSAPLASTWTASDFVLPNSAIDYRPLALQTTPLSLGGDPQNLRLTCGQRASQQTVSIHLDPKGWQTAALDNEVHLRVPKVSRLPMRAYAVGGLSLNRIDTTIAPGLHYGGGLAIEATSKLNFKLGYTSNFLDLSGNAGPSVPNRQFNASLAYRF